MTPTTVICDSSAVVALLLDAGSVGTWAAETLTGAHLAAPALIGFEAGNIIRRHEASGAISADQALQAHADLHDLEIEEWPYRLLALRAFELRNNVTIYDASYIALAEALRAPLATLDRRLSRAPGIRCTVLTPPEQ